jgi:hypothetical protein
MSENDGKNGAQLLKYARFESYLQSLIIYRGTSPDLAWHRDHTVDSLVLWLLWKTSRRGAYQRDPTETTLTLSQHLLSLKIGHIVNTFWVFCTPSLSRATE